MEVTPANICPLCNGLSQLVLSCPTCQAQLDDCGILENYWGPYSPYSGEELLDMIDGVWGPNCIHLFSCPQCGHEEKHVIKHINTSD